METLPVLGGIGGGNYYAGEEATGMLNAKMAHQPTLAQRLDLAVAQAEEKLASVKRAREIFQKNPDLEELLNIMQRMHF